MKKGLGIGGLVLLGFLIWWLGQKAKEARAAEAPAEAYVSEYERLHAIVPITKYVEKKIPVFESIEQYREATYG